MSLVSFYIPWNYQKTRSFSNIFRGYRKRPGSWNWLKWLCVSITLFSRPTFHFYTHWYQNTSQKVKFSIKDFSSKCDQIRRKSRIWSHLLEKYLMENLICTLKRIFFAEWSYFCLAVNHRPFLLSFNEKHSTQPETFN